MDTTGGSGGRWANPRWFYPEYPAGSVVEIRVHGVGGEPPTSMTRDPHPVLVGGDDVAGFFRARNPVVGAVVEPDPEGFSPDGRTPLHVREVLSWGGQTSGTVRHAFWVLLLPFAIFNVAGRMHVVGDAGRAAWHRATCRVLALTMTLAVTAITCGLAFDLVAVQCGAWQDACLGGDSAGQVLLGPFRRFSSDVVGRLGIAALLPTALVVALWYSGRYRTGQLEGYVAPERRRREGDRRRDEPTSLADPDFWRNAWPASRLRGLHATGAFALIASVLAASLYVVEAGSRAAGASVWLSLAAIAAAVVLLSLVVAAMPGMATPGPDDRLHRLLTSLRFAAVGLLGFAVGAATLGRIPFLPRRVPGIDVRLPADVGWVVAGVLGMVCILVWAVGTRPLPRTDIGSAFAIRPGMRRERPDVSIGKANVLLAAGAVLVGWSAGGLWNRLLGDPNPFTVPTLGEFPGTPRGLDWAVDLMPGVFVPPYVPLLALVLVQTGLLLVLAWAAWTTTWPSRPGSAGLDRAGPVVGNLTAVVAALLSLFLITAIGAGLHTVALQTLGERVSAFEPTGVADQFLPAARHRFTGDVRLTLPWWHAVTALVVALMPVIAGIVVVLRGRRRRDLAPSAAEVADHLTPSYVAAGLEAPDPDDPSDAERLEEVGRGWLVQHLIRDGGTILTWIVGLTLALVLGVLVGYLGSGRPTGRPVPFTTPAVWVVSAIPVVAIGLVRTSLRDRGARREIGRVWDVVTFWPRVTHPFAPPCYGEAVVPMLEHKIRSLLDRPQRYGVVLAGHSQGSVVSLAATARLGATDPSGRRRTALVTYGTPIAILYERYFPATLRVDGTAETVFDHVGERVRTWHHLFALTEPFAYPFWEVDPDADPIDRVRGWAVSSSLPFVEEECPGCDPADDEPFATRLELLVRDPDRWRLTDGSWNRPAGHSAYHRHPDVDRHLARVAATLTRDVPRSDGEQRAGRWWRAVP